MPERVRPKSGIFCQCMPLGSTARVKCSASIDTQPLVSTNPTTDSRFGSAGLNTGTVTATLRSFGPLTVIDPRLTPAGTMSQLTLTQTICSPLTVPPHTLQYTH